MIFKKPWICSSFFKVGTPCLHYWVLKEYLMIMVAAISWKAISNKTIKRFLFIVILCIWPDYHIKSATKWNRTLLFFDFQQTAYKFSDAAFGSLKFALRYTREAVRYMVNLSFTFNCQNWFASNIYYNFFFSSNS